MVFGTFDGLHAGHRNFFSQAAKLGDVTAVVARDASVKKIKGKLPHYRERSRLATVARETKVRKAMLGDKQDFFKIITKNPPDIIALGFDQKTFSIPALRQELKKRNFIPHQCSNKGKIRSKSINVSNVSKHQTSQNKIAAGRVPRIVRLKSYKPNIFKSSLLRKKH